MASVSFEQQRGRSGRVPLSFFYPVIVTDNTPFWKVMPNNAVPNGMGTKDERIGYWNEQKRWRMRKGQRIDLPSKWHFYFLGTGPHKDASFRQRLDGVYWVAVNGAKTQPTSLGSRKKNAAMMVPQFSVSLPSNIQVQTENASAPASRNQSQNRSQSANRSQSRGPNQNVNQNQNTNGNQRARSQSRNRGSNNNQPQNQVDIVAAVKAALQQLGVGNQNQGGTGKKSKSNSGVNTPKEQRAKSPAKTPPVQRKQMERPVWKRVPNSSENVTACFGPRDAVHNFGDSDVVHHGTDAKHWPQLAELIPTPAALAFGSEISTTEVGDKVEITYTYKMKVDKADKNLPAFLQQVSAYAQPSQANQISSQLNPVAPVFTPGMDDSVEIIDQVFDTDV
uniref:Nucleoprotein n=1 Tax=Bat Coronavirus RaGD19 TaxID=3018879 RepID=A0AA49EC93_9NIDO|nr:nucleocapsid phosphoprotein [Bat Coronavirus RaGD19]